MSPAIIYGINPVLEAIRAERVKSIRVVERVGGRVAEIVAAAERAGIDVRRVSAQELDRAARGGVHQGVVAEAVARETFDVSDLVSGAKDTPLLVVLDSIEDPAERGRDSAVGRRGRRRRSDPAVAPRRGAGRCGSEGVGGRGVTREDCRRREHRARARGAERGRRVDGRARRRCPDSLRSRSISPFRRLSSSAPRARA